MRPLVLSLVLSFLALGCGDPDPACEPACRDGFACVRGMCVSACNPAWGPGEVCMAGARCVPAELPDSALVPADSGAIDASGHDVGTSIDARADIDAAGASGDDAFVTPSPDAAVVADAGPPRCGPGMAVCAGAYRAATAPEVGVRTPTTGTYGSDFFDTGAPAVDPCTGTMGLAYPQQVSRSDNDELGTPVAGDTGTFSNIVISVSDGQASSSLRAFSILVGGPTNGAATISWSPPTENVDGSPIMNLAGHRVLYGQASASLNQQVDIPTAGVTSAVIEGLASGTWYFAVKAYTTANVMSDPSGVVTKVVN